jgi:hypothetical protein
MHDDDSNERLRATDVPPVTASWHEIGGFALTLDGYEVMGHRECGKLANRVSAEFAKNPTFLRELEPHGIEGLPIL